MARLRLSSSASRSGASGVACHPDALSRYIGVFLKTILAFFLDAMATDLANAWEGDAIVRANARRQMAVSCPLSCLFLSSKVIREGDVVTRDCLVMNERFLTHTICHLGSRVGLDVLQLHLTALYELMETPTPRALEAIFACTHDRSSLPPDATIHAQAWVAKRCLTIYNDICRRPYLPRQAEVRRLMANTGVDLTTYGPSSTEELAAANELDQEAEGEDPACSYVEEAEEEEARDEDECAYG